MARTNEPMFPILGDDCLKAIPWKIIAPHERQAEKNHDQTLRRLAERGGLSPCEAVAVMTDQPWRPMNNTFARAKLMSLAWTFEREASQPQQDKPTQEQPK